MSSPVTFPLQSSGHCRHGNLSSSCLDQGSATLEVSRHSGPFVGTPNYPPAQPLGTAERPILSKTKSQKTAKTTTQESSDSESSELIASHALSVSSSNEQCAWIIDSGATCHMCQDSMLFTTLYQLQDPIDVVLGDGRALTAARRGEVVLDMILPNGSRGRVCCVMSFMYPSSCIISSV